MLTQMRTAVPTIVNGINVTPCLLGRQKRRRVGRDTLTSHFGPAGSDTELLEKVDERTVTCGRFEV
jgi:hypothetical protein